MAPRALHQLSARTVAAKTKPGYYADGGGLYLQVSPSGSKSWIFRFTKAGRAREMGLGSLRAVSLARAREKAQDARSLLADGTDPIQARRDVQTAATLAEMRSKPFRECAEAFIEAHRAGWKNAKHVAQWENTLETYCYPTLGDLPVASIDAGLVLKVLEPIWNEKPETASRLRGRIESILDWATVRGYREGLNPARWRGHLDQTLPKRSKVAKIVHHAALPYVEAPAFMKALRAIEGVAPRALEFIILTACRTGEAIAAEWSEIDLAHKVWTIPASRMKAKREHKVPLSDRAVEILRGLEKGAFVFPGRSGEQPLSNMACLKVLERMERDDITTHGFRSTFRDWAAERTNFPGFVVEMALAHTIESKVEAAYRRGDLFGKRRQLMAAWSDYLKSQPSKATIHHIAGKTAPAGSR
jgi:integrase